MEIGLCKNVAVLLVSAKLACKIVRRVNDSGLRYCRRYAIHQIGWGCFWTVVKDKY